MAIEPKQASLMSKMDRTRMMKNVASKINLALIVTISKLPKKYTV